MSIRIHAPRKNLRTIGFEITDNLYFDFFVEPYLGMFFRYKEFKVSFCINYTKWTYRSYGMFNIHRW
jgi:hypothetical protein